MLQNLARDIQGQITRINDAAYESQIAGHQLLCIVHDEYPAYVELNTVASFAIPQVERGLRGYIEQQDIFIRAFHTAMDIDKRVGEIVRDMFIEFVILFLGDFALGANP